MKPPIHPLLFQRSLAGEGGLLGFRVRFPGRTPDDARRWLKARGYEFIGGSWLRPDRKLSRMGYRQRAEHTSRMQARRARAIRFRD